MRPSLVASVLRSRRARRGSLVLLAVIAGMLGCGARPRIPLDAPLYEEPVGPAPTSASSADGGTAAGGSGPQKRPR